jgi:hypothetical protein
LDCCEQVRGTGLVLAIEFAADKTTREAFPTKWGMFVLCATKAFSCHLVFLELKLEIPKSINKNCEPEFLLVYNYFESGMAEFKEIFDWKNFQINWRLIGNGCGNLQRWGHILEGSVLLTVY